MLENHPRICFSALPFDSMLRTMNGVAKDFWSEVYDLRGPVDDGDGGRKQSRSGKKKARKTLVRRATRRIA